ncbi:MAG: PQQ-binding-like beta-propeller repeat protein [Candidatus Eremiobacteraeota bacterium]|nr:PQQ-binding-like beta-propeller repeat protein [Candidatus Eremiobacteraeota bacterium]
MEINPSMPNISVSQPPGGYHFSGATATPVDSFSKSTPSGSGIYSPQKFQEVFENAGEEWTFKMPPGDHCKGFVMGNEGSLYATTHNKIIKVDTTNGKLQWEKGCPSGVSSMPPKVTREGAALVTTDDGYLMAFDPADGHRQWSYHTTTTGTHPFVSPDGTILCQRDDELCALSSDGKKKWSFKMNTNDMRIDGAQDDGTVFAVNSRGVHAVSGKGSSQWFHPCTNGGCIAVHNDNVYITAARDELRALDPATGREKWKIPLGEAGVIAGNDGVLAIQGHMQFRVIDPKDGASIWAVSTKDDERIKAIDNRGTVITGSRDNHIRAYDRNTGKVLWTYKAESSTVDGQARFDSKGRLLISDRNNIYGIDPMNGNLQYRSHSRSRITSWGLDEKNSLILLQGADSGKVTGVNYRTFETTSHEEFKKDYDITEEDKVIEGPGFVVIGGVKLKQKS